MNFDVSLYFIMFFIIEVKSSMGNMCQISPDHQPLYSNTGISNHSINQSSRPHSSLGFPGWCSVWTQ